MTEHAGVESRRTRCLGNQATVSSSRQLNTEPWFIQTNKKVNVHWEGVVHMFSHSALEAEALNLSLHGWDLEYVSRNGGIYLTSLIDYASYISQTPNKLCF